MKKILYLVIIICIFVACLSFGGYTLEQFANEIHLRNPSTVLSPITNGIKNSGNNINIPQNSNGYTFDPNAKLFNNNTQSSNIENSNIENSNSYSENSSSNTIQESNKEESTNNNQESISQDSNQESTIQDSNQESVSEEVKDTINSKTYKFTIGEKTFELNKDTAANFVKWISDNVKNNEKISYVTNTIKDKLNQNSIESSVEQSSSKEESNVKEFTEENNEEESKESNIKESVTESSVENKIKVSGTTLLEIEKLSSSINVVKELPKYTDYDRNLFEKPVKSYILDGKKINRNDYAWKTSKYFNSQDFTYTCPYTGKIIHDLDDGKEDQDFSKLDYDHLVPVKSAYERGARDWPQDKKNQYAYDQFVGVDVTASANRSKSDKGPAQWLPTINKGSYCYSWLKICNKYNLSMTQEEIDICKNEIFKAIKNGETIEFMCGS